jgi:hypothetical protein
MTMKNARMRVAIALPLSLVLLFGCSEPGPAEQAGKKVDEAVEKVRDRIDPAGPAERAGRKIDEAVEELTYND